MKTPSKLIFSKFWGPKCRHLGPQKELQGFLYRYVKLHHSQDAFLLHFEGPLGSKKCPTELQIRKQISRTRDEVKSHIFMSSLARKYHHRTSSLNYGTFDFCTKPSIETSFFVLRILLDRSLLSLQIYAEELME